VTSEAGEVDRAAVQQQLVAVDGNGPNADRQRVAVDNRPTWTTSTSSSYRFGAPGAQSDAFGTLRFASAVGPRRSTGRSRRRHCVEMETGNRGRTFTETGPNSDEPVSGGDVRDHFEIR